MAGYCTCGQYFHLPLAREDTLPTRAKSCRITLYSRYRYKPKRYQDIGIGATLICHYDMSYHLCMLFVIFLSSYDHYHITVKSIEAETTSHFWNYFKLTYDPSNPCSYHYQCPCNSCITTHQIPALPHHFRLSAESAN